MTKEQITAARQKLCSIIYDTAKSKGITHREISEVTGFSENNVSRMLSGRYPPTLDNLIKLCDAVKLKIVLK